MILTAKAKLAGVVGWPVAHSRSPRLHGYWLDQLSIDGAYVPLAIAPEHLASCIKSLARMGFAGLNVTVPHKESIVSMLDGIDPLAKRIGAVNTVIFGRDGLMVGRNTDAFGFRENLRQTLPDHVFLDRPAVVLGAGGAARAVVVALQDMGISQIFIANRSTDRVAALIRDIPGPMAVPWEDRSKVLRGAELLVNTTVLGQSGQAPLEIDLSLLPPQAVVTDIVYVPLETDLLKAAKARGNKVVDGLGMLLWQAVPGFEAWFGKSPPVNAELRRFVLGES